MFVSMRIHRLSAALLAAAVLVCCGCVGTIAAVRETGRGSVKLPVVMYHNILRRPDWQGKYVVSPQTLESDLKWLAGNGYHTVVVRDLLEYAAGTSDLPEKPVMLTFDDGYYNNYYYAYPLAKKYGVKIMISPVGAYTDQYTNGEADHVDYSYLTWGEITEMMRSGTVEIQNHSYNLHSMRRRPGAQKLKKESAGTYTAMLRQDLIKMQNEMLENTGCEPTAFVYPFGLVSPESLPVIRELGFQASFTCNEKTNRIRRGDPECLFGLGRYLRQAGVSSERFFRKIGL